MIPSFDLLLRYGWTFHSRPLKAEAQVLGNRHRLPRVYRNRVPVCGQPRSLIEDVRVPRTI